MNGIEVRELLPADMPFLFATWLKTYKSTSSFAKEIRPGVFFKYHHRLVERLVQRPGCRVLIAAPKGDRITIIGYLVCEVIEGHPTVHYAYTKGPFRRMGVMRALFEFAGIDPREMRFTHRTPDGDSLRQKWPSAVFNPYLL